MPTNTELKTETYDNGVRGSATAFSNFLKFPVAGYRYESDGSIFYQGTRGYVWTSIGQFGAWGLDFDSGFVAFLLNHQSSGWSVRCVEN